MKVFHKRGLPVIATYPKTDFQTNAIVVIFHYNFDSRILTGISELLISQISKFKFLDLFVILSEMVKKSPEINITLPQQWLDSCRLSRKYDFCTQYDVRHTQSQSAGVQPIKNLNLTFSVDEVSCSSTVTAPAQLKNLFLVILDQQRLNGGRQEFGQSCWFIPKNTYSLRNYSRGTLRSFYFMQ